jgi:hypothetical protein
MKIRIIEQPAMVYDQPDLNQPLLTTLPVGTEIEMGGVKKKSGKDWVTVKLPDGQKGYLPGETRIFHIKPVALLDNEVEVYSSPSMVSLEKRILKKNSKVFLMDVVKQPDRDWVKIREFSGRDGYIDGKVRIKNLPEITKSIGRRNILVGALWFFGGLIVTIATYSAATSGGSSNIIAWGAVLFGAIQLIQGIIQVISAPY